MVDDPEAMLKIRMSSEARERANAEKRRQQWGGEKGAKKLGAHLRGVTRLPIDEEDALIHSRDGLIQGLPLLVQLAEDRLREIREGNYQRERESVEEWHRRKELLAQFWIQGLARIAEADTPYFLQAVASGENQDLGDPLSDLLESAIENLERFRAALEESKSGQSSN